MTLLFKLIIEVDINKKFLHIKMYPNNQYHAMSYVDY